MQRQVKEAALRGEQEPARRDGVDVVHGAGQQQTCETCAPLDQMRWEQGDVAPASTISKAALPDWPIHPNCRCEALLIDPEDEFWNETERTVQQHLQSC